MKNPYRVVIFPGDGIGPEVMSVSLQVLRAVQSESLKFDFIEHPIGAAHYQRTGEVLPESVVDDCRKADAVFLAAMGLHGLGDLLVECLLNADHGCYPSDTKRNTPFPR